MREQRRGISARLKAEVEVRTASDAPDESLLEELASLISARVASLADLLQRPSHLRR
jgi:hypothetical protein